MRGVCVLLAVAMGVATAANTSSADPPGGCSGGTVKLRPAHGGHGIGTVTITGRQGFERVRVDAKLTPSRRGETYEIWLYEAHDDAVSLGRRRAGRSEKLRFASDMPAPLEAYGWIDISREKVRGGSSHSGKSVLRAKISTLCR